MNLLQAGDSSSSAEVSAFEGGDGIGKSQNVQELPILEETINESCMEDIACAGRIDRLYFKSFHVNEFSFHQCNGTIMTQCGTEKPRYLFLKFGESFFSI